LGLLELGLQTRNLVLELPVAPAQALELGLGRVTLGDRRVTLLAHLSAVGEQRGQELADRGAHIQL
jgi:hypothetical protein